MKKIILIVLMTALTVIAFSLVRKSMKVQVDHSNVPVISSRTANLESRIW